MAEVLLRLDNVTRRITSEFYIKNVDLTVYRGEVLALCGKNAAGKSTLAAVISGALPADSGRIWLEGREERIASTEDAMRLGIIMLTQNNGGFPAMSVADNVLFGNRKYYVSGIIGTRKLFAICGKCFDELGIEVDPTVSFSRLTPAQRQMAALARAYLSDAKLVIMDEPSSHLPQEEQQTLFRVVRALRDAGVSVLYITHRLGEVLELCDRAVFVRRGEITAVREVAGMTELDLIEEIEGFRVENLYGQREGALGDVLLEARGFATADAVSPLDFTLRQGELVAVLGGASSGVRTLCCALCGLVPYRGDVLVRGEKAELRSPLEADARRIVCAVDEATERAVSHYDSKGGRHSGPLFRALAGVKEAASAFGEAMAGVTGASRLRQSEYMTGGYRQRELMQRTMARDADIYLLAEPSNGVDLQTRLSIYADIRRAQERGRGVVLFTGDPAEALGLADTVIVLRPGGALAVSAKETSLEALKNSLHVQS